MTSSPHARAALEAVQQIERYADSWMRWGGPSDDVYEVSARVHTLAREALAQLAPLVQETQEKPK